MIRFFLSYLIFLASASVVFAQQTGNGTVGRVIKEIRVEGNNITKTRIILRELSVAVGQRVPQDSVTVLIQQNKLRLFNLQLFNEVDQETESAGGDSLIWHIRVKERWYVIPTAILQFADRNINTWWVDQNHDVERVSAGLTVTNRNFRGNLEALSLTFQAGYTQKLGVSYMLPYVNKGQTHGFGIVAAAARSNQTYYATENNKLQFAGLYSGPVVWRQAEGGISYVYRPAYARRHVLQLMYREMSVGDTILRLNHDFFADSSTRAQFAEVNYRYEYNGVDNWSYSLTGEKLVATAVARAGWRGLNTQLFTTVEAGVFRRPLPHWYVSAVVRGRLMAPATLPYYFRNGLGTQTDYVRGYEYYVTDGYQYGLVRLSLKRELFNNTYSLPVRYFTAVPVRIYPKVFFDAGYINNPSPRTNTLVNTWQYSVGVGLDLVTFYDMKVRVEYARNHLGQNGLYLHFNSE